MSPRLHKMSNYTCLLLIIVAVLGANVWAKSDSNQPPQTPMPDGRDDMATCDPSGNPALLTGQCYKNTPDHGPPGLEYSKKKQAVKTKKSILDSYKIFPIHERFRIAIFYLVKEISRSLFHHLYDPEQNNPNITDKVCLNDDYVIAGVVLFSGLVVGLLAFINYFRIRYCSQSTGERPKIHMRKILVPLERTFNLRSRGL